jgi:hypothetical protein
VATLKSRIIALETAAAKSDKGDRFNFAPVMSVDEWSAIAPAQQAQLVKRTLELATQQGDAWQH